MDGNGLMIHLEPLLLMKRTNAGEGGGGELPAFLRLDLGLDEWEQFLDTIEYTEQEREKITACIWDMVRPTLPWLGLFLALITHP